MLSKKDILVLGATGTVGSELVRLLTAAGEPVRAASRSRSPRPTTSGARFVPFDLEDPATFDEALRGVDRVFLIARPGDDEPQRVAAPFLAALRRHGVQRVVNLSALGVEMREDFGLRKVERMLEAEGLAVTHLRPNFFMQIFTTPPLGPGIQASRAIRLPAGEARLSFIDARDIAKVAAHALTHPGTEGQGYALTGPAALSHADVAQAISEATGVTVHYEALSEEAARTAITASGLSPERAERLIGFYRLVRQGFCAPVSDAVERLLGHPAADFASFARDHAAAWL